MAPGMIKTLIDLVLIHSFPPDYHIGPFILHCFLFVEVFAEKNKTIQA